MRRDEADAAIRVIRELEFALPYEASRRILQGEPVSEVWKDLDAKFNAAYWGAINEVRARPWWRRLFDV